MDRVRPGVPGAGLHPFLGGNSSQGRWEFEFFARTTPCVPQKHLPPPWREEYVCMCCSGNLQVYHHTAVSIRHRACVGEVAISPSPARLGDPLSAQRGGPAGYIVSLTFFFDASVHHSVGGALCLLFVGLFSFVLLAWWWWWMRVNKEGRHSVRAILRYWSPAESLRSLHARYIRCARRLD